MLHAECIFTRARQLGGSIEEKKTAEDLVRLSAENLRLGGAGLRVVTQLAT